jgi:acetyltransferase-like isoleucine patch superfamily enzyme
MKALVLGVIRFLGRLWCGLHGVKTGAGVLVQGFPRFRSKNGAPISLGDRATLNAALWTNPLNDGRRTVLHAAGGSGISIGPDAGISSSRLIAFSGISIGAGTLIGAGCLICDSDMHEVPLGSGKKIATAPILIGRNVFIGAGSTILKGVTIGDGTVIGAGSIVTSSIPSGAMAAGNPARVIRFLKG